MKKLLAVLMISVGLMLALPLRAASAQTGNCDDNSVIRCGAFSASTLQSSMTGDVPAIFAHYGIAQDDFNTLTNGTVRKDGTVWVNGRMVANQAVSVGRHDMPGSTPVAGLGVYERPPSVSFASNELAAFVKMNNGQFVYAIIKSCGNPVRANPVTPTPPAQPPAANTGTPAITITKSVNKTNVQLNEQFTYTVVVRNIGSRALTNAVITDTPPAGVQFIAGSATTSSKAGNRSSVTTTSRTNQTATTGNATGTSSTTNLTNSGTYTGLAQNNFSATIPTLAVGETHTITFNARVTEQVQGQLVNTVCVNVPEIAGDRDACASATVQLAAVVTPAVVTAPAPIITSGAAPAAQTPVPGKGQPLPATGAGAVAGLGVSTTIASYAGSLLYTRLRNRFML